MFQPTPQTAAHKGFHVMVKPVGPRCNLACQYCFYLEKEALFPSDEQFRMSGKVLENFTRSYIQSQPPGTTEITFAWQGGEPTLMGLDFYRRAVALQQKYRDGRNIQNAFQTNGTRIDHDWASFFKEHNFLVGVSIDGPERIHDAYRIRRGGGGSFKDVVRGIGLLQKHGVEWNSLTCVNRLNAAKGDIVYRFLKGIGARLMQFIPIVAKWMGASGGICVHAESCGDTLAMEHDGSVYACDHYVYPAFKRGNIGDDWLGDMVNSQAQRKFGLDKRDRLPPQCLNCRYLFACNGGCPKHRFIETADGNPGLNYLCSGYRRFFSHIDPYMQDMTRLYASGQAPAAIMDLIQEGNLPFASRN